MNQRALDVLLLLDDIPRSDRMMDEFSALGLEGVACFSIGEAVSVVVNESPDAVVIDAGIEDAENLDRWLRGRYSGMVCLLHEFGDPTDTYTGEEEEVDLTIEEYEETEDVVAQLMGALVVSRQRRAPVGRSKGPARY